LFEHHDHRDFEILCYSGVEQPDQLTDKFRRHADQWRSTVGVSDEALAEMIRRDGVDILVDLTQHMAGNRLPMFARKPAPVQVSFAGYPESAGLEAIEYRISDRHLEAGSPVAGLSEAGPATDRYLEASSTDDETGNPVAGLFEAGPAFCEAAPPRPPHEETGSNEQLFLIDSFWCYDPCGANVEVNNLPAGESGRVTFGCLNNFCKVNEPVLRLWAHILGKLEDSRLVLASPVGSHRQRTLDVLGREGVDAHRVDFAERRPYREYLELYHRLDIVLDPHPYNGGVTSCEALWMGVPMVSLIGDMPVSRAGLSLLSNLGLPELLAHSENEYVNIAESLAMDLPRLAQLRATLRGRMENSVLMDAPRFARQVEHAYRSMWKRWRLENLSNRGDS
jgi:protein O-GlcNAc transferase